MDKSGSADKVFAGSVPRLYDDYLVPLIFAPYALDLVSRLKSKQLARVLEIAAGTGVVTRALAASLPENVQIVATDLNQAMLDQAALVGTARPVEWRQAEAGELPFADEEFDAVVCQFGVMFFPDKSKAFAETRRVLKRQGSFIFSVWDRIEENEFAAIITSALASLFADDPPRFLARTPHGYSDPLVVASDLVKGGFKAPPKIDILAARSRAESARLPAVAYCQGTPLRNEIEARQTATLEEATDVAAAALEQRFGRGAVDGKIQALVIEVEK